MSIRVSIIEDHVEFRKSISFILNSAEGFICSGEFDSIESALKNEEEPDVILLDINLPGMSGIEGLPLLKKKFPNSKIIMLTVFEEDKKVFHSILSGADGYILKKTPPTRILQAIEDAVEGGAPITPIIAKQALNLFMNYVPKKNETSCLSVREKEILSLIITGLSNDEISEKLFISLHTVRNHIRNIYQKLQVHSKSQAVVKAIKQGIL